MLTRTLYNIYKKPLMMLCLLAAVSCTDEIVDDKKGNENPDDQDKGIGQMVLFSSGNVTNASTGTRADVIPYMELDGRFVCKMFYRPNIGDTEDSNYDIDGTAQTAWLKVNDNVGSCVYRNNVFGTISDETLLNDPDATCFYWKNRLNHIFLAYADYNKLKSNLYSTETTTPPAENEGETPQPVTKAKQGSLFMYPEYDEILSAKIGEEVIGYRKLVITDSKYDTTTVVNGSLPWTESQYSELYVNDIFTTLPEDLQKAMRRMQYSKTNDDGSKDVYSSWRATKGENPTVFCIITKQEFQQLKASVFDLRRATTMNSMTDQPDPIVAYTKMKPAGATQEANRVRLYFKHQFSQIQVNLKNAATSTSDIQEDNIDSVELLGVTNKGYIFTYVLPDGTPIDPTYEPVVVTQKNEENPYGTIFNMFPMTTPEPGAIKSFNAIAFGELQAIRITWHEYKTDGTKGVEHKATYQVTTDDKNQNLKLLQSGYRYVYDITLQRGTLAVIRTIIDGWMLDDELIHDTEGTISN